MIITDDAGKSPTIEKALELVDRQADNLETWRIKGLGLRLVLLGLAEVQALRVSRLGGMVYKLEEELLNTEKIRTLEPKLLFGLYNLAAKSLTESSEFIERTLKTVDWSAMETELLQVKAQEANKTTEGIDAADSEEILSFIAQMKARKDKETPGETPKNG